MHNRRFGAFLIGAWLGGTLMVWFATAQSLLSVDRLLQVAPPPLQKTVAAAGSEQTQLLLRHQAQQLNRRVTETWAVTQMIIALAVLGLAVFTSYRSAFLIGGSALLACLSCAAALWIVPELNALGRVLDFAPPGTATGQRETLFNLRVWHRVVVVLGSLTAAAIAARLLMDLSEIRSLQRRARSFQTR